MLVQWLVNISSNAGEMLVNFWSKAGEMLVESRLKAGVVAAAAESLLCGRRDVCCRAAARVAAWSAVWRVGNETGGRGSVRALHRTVAVAIPLAAT